MTEITLSDESSAAERIGIAWNRFWFTPSDPLPLCVLRVLSGCVALLHHFSYTADLILWFGPDGLLPKTTVSLITGEDYYGSGMPSLSYLNFAHSPTTLWILHGLGFVVLIAFTVGFKSRIASVLSAVVLLSYVHRAPMITSHLEPVLTMLVLYLCLAPSGTYLSVDRWLARKGNITVPDAFHLEKENNESKLSNVSLRLIQVHIAALYLMMSFTKLGTNGWWLGEAMWLLIAQSESRLIDLTFLRDHTYLINIWTHGVVLFELLFGLLIWHRDFRPYLLVISVVMWIGLALVTGLVLFCLLMLLANAAYLRPAALQRVFSRQSFVQP